MVLPNRIAAISNRDGADSQTLLRHAVAGWRRAGVNVVGVLAEDGDDEAACSAAFLRDIASGRSFSIQLDATPAGTSCHLDVDGIGAACAGLLPQIEAADLVVLSKFGKTEAARQGLWAAFSTAIASAKPLLTTVSPKHAAAWEGFAPQAVRLEPDGRSIEDWRRSVVEAPR